MLMTEISLKTPKEKFKSEHPLLNSDIVTKELMFAGVSMFLADSGSFWPEPQARGKMSPEKGQKNIFTPKNINSIRSSP